MTVTEANEGLYKKASLAVDKWLEFHKGETFDLDTICRQMEIRDAEKRHQIVRKLSYEVSKGKLEKSNRSYRYIDNTIIKMNWRDSAGAANFPLGFPTGLDGTDFGFDGHVQIPEKGLVVIAGVTNTGKALANGTPVLTPNGWVAIEDLRTGGKVIGKDGLDATIQGVWTQGERHCYRFVFNDGSFIDSDGEHLWSVLIGGNRVHKVTGHGAPSKLFGQYKTITTSEIISHCGLGKQQEQSYRRVELPPIQPSLLPHQEVPMDAYVLGVLLGDGSFSQSSIGLTSNDIEIVNEVQRFFKLTAYGKYQYRVLNANTVIRQ
jgi:hypothetical protein